MSKGSNNNIQAVERAFLVIETISRVKSINFSELQKKLEINKASLSRVINTLISIGYIKKNQQNGALSLTLKTYEVGISAIEHIDHINLIKSTLIDLRNEIGLISQFSIEDNNELICLQSIGYEDSLFSGYTDVGSHCPLYSTSAGKAILATYSNNEIMDKWEDFDVQEFTENTHTNIDDLLDDISEIRRRGYSLDMEESDYGLFCLGTVIMGNDRNPIGAISVSTDSMTAEEEEKLSEILLQKAKRLSRLLGYTS